MWTLVVKVWGGLVEFGSLTFKVISTERGFRLYMSVRDESVESQIVNDQSRVFLYLISR